MNDTAPSSYGLIGFPVEHSFSPAWFRAKFAREQINARYTAFSLPDINGLPDLLRKHPELSGLNVTIPHKITVLPFLDELDDAARHIGAVNCIKITQGWLKGYNTDATGFLESLRPLLKSHHRQALILGTGGASKAVSYALTQLDISHQFISRTPAAGVRTYETLGVRDMQAYTIIINTTPTGMYPDTSGYPSIPYSLLGPGYLAYDLIYNPEETTFLSLSRQAGASVKNGREMLELQAEAAWDIWTTKK